MNARRVSTIVSTTLIGLALAGGGAITAPSAGAATISALVASDSPTPSGGTASDSQAPKAGDPKPAETAPVKHAAAHSKGKRAKTTRVSSRTRSHRVGKAGARHRKPMAPAGTSSSAGVPMAG